MQRFYNDVWFFFCLSATFYVSTKIAPIFDIRIFSDRKVNLVDTFWISRLKIKSCFKKRREKQK